MTLTLPFLAVDLETTGLDPQTDTIIEIAAIRFDLVLTDEGFSLRHVEERSMLINPGCPLSEEVTLITGITESMLAWRVSWDAVRDRVADFIGSDTIILGHNVLFDVSMLASHGIDLSSHPILDTFELAEIFSQHASSLNLGFLGDFYGIQKRGEEHRALTDTWVAVDLFLFYLSHISALSGMQKILWKYALRTSTLSLLAPLFDTTLSETDTTEWHEWTSSLRTRADSSHVMTDIPDPEAAFSLVSLEHDGTSEIDLIQSTRAEHGNIRIIVRNKKSAENLQALLREHHLDAIIAYEPYEFIAASEVIAALESMHETTDRKQHIFLIKMAFWLTETHTGLLSELKYYGNEFSQLESFRLHASESHAFFKAHQAALRHADITIARYTEHTRASQTFSLFKDISLFEEAIRKAHIHTIRFEALIDGINALNAPRRSELIACLRTLEAMYVNIPDRGTGEHPIPPGKYGETYFFTQESLWQWGCKWTSIANRHLAATFELWKSETDALTKRSDRIRRERIITDISQIIAFQTQEFPHTGVILTIAQDATNIQYIPRNIDAWRDTLFVNGLGYGFHLSADGMGGFIERELGMKATHLSPKIHEPSITTFSPLKSLDFTGRTLILTTSMKHIRELGAALATRSEVMLLQGTSGGKSKIKHYFLESPQSILIGLIDSWRDEADLFPYVQRVIIAKIPFDPPTDPYFLAKTNGMPHSFDRYSKPIVLSRLNTLIGDIHTKNPHTAIICSDERIHTTTWGNFMRENLF